MVYVKSNELYHHGIKGQQWGKKNGPPYPLGVSDHSASERKAGWRKSLKKSKVSKYDSYTDIGELNKAHHEAVIQIKQSKDPKIKKTIRVISENKAYNKKSNELEKLELGNKKALTTLMIAGGLTLYGLSLYSILSDDYGYSGLSSTQINSINSTIASNLAYSTSKDLDVFSDSDSDSDNFDAIIDELLEGGSLKKTNNWLHSLEDKGVLGNAKCFYDKKSGHGYASTNLLDKQWWLGLSTGEKTSIKYYTSFGYKAMNNALRNPNSHSSLSTKTQIKNCTDALKKASLPNDAIVHRGVGSLSSLSKTLGVPEDMLKDSSAIKSLIGLQYVDPAFGSSGASTADAWSGCKLHILLPKGSQAMYIDPVSSMKGEHEVLINRGAKYVIRDVQSNSKGSVSDLFIELIENTIT